MIVVLFSLLSWLEPAAQTRNGTLSFHADQSPHGRKHVKYLKPKSRALRMASPGLEGLQHNRPLQVGAPRVRDHARAAGERQGALRRYALI